MINRIKYSFNKLDYLYYLFIGIFIFSYLNNSQIININNIISVIITFFILYFLIYLKTKDSYNKMNHQYKSLSAIDLNKYKYVGDDPYVVNCLNKLKNLSTFNRIKFNDFMNNLNKFFLYYNISKNRHLRPNDNYEKAYEHGKQVLNILSSFSVDLNNYNFLKNDREFSNKYVLENINLPKCIEKIKIRMSIYLSEMIFNINKEWSKGNINIYSKPIYPDDPDINVLDSNQYSEIYDIY